MRRTGILPKESLESVEERLAIVMKGYRETTNVTELECVIGQKAVEIQVRPQKCETTPSVDRLIAQLAGQGIPVAETRRILNLSRTSCYRWQERSREGLLTIQPESSGDATGSVVEDAIRQVAGEYLFWRYRRVSPMEFGQSLSQRPEAA